MSTQYGTHSQQNSRQTQPAVAVDAAIIDAATVDALADSEPIARVEMMNLFMVVLLMGFEGSMFDSLRVQITVRRLPG